ncbi:hypothetical protein [Lacinutrix algicola]|uniref:hypothetical protein n=1 Tax=Lacinutrix algicola TaxID=342954 RepID=UPI0006E2433F|nr:hypothetical protein [Lacinutrix algicola]
MNKIEKMLGFGLIILSIFRLIINYPYSGQIITLFAFVLSLIYFFLSFELFKSTKKDPTDKTSLLRKTGIIITGITLALVVLGILFKFMRWPNGSWMLKQSLLWLIPILIIVIYKFSKTKAEFYKNLLSRILIIGFFGILLLFTKNETLLEMQYQDFPEYVEAEKNLMLDPMNKELERIANKEHKKMLQSE